MKELKDNFFKQRLAPALANIVKMMARNDTMFLVGGKVSVSVLISIFRMFT